LLQAVPAGNSLSFRLRCQTQKGNLIAAKSRHDFPAATSRCLFVLVHAFTRQPLKALWLGW
jgi:hypothetical protein